MVNFSSLFLHFSWFQFICKMIALDLLSSYLLRWRESDEGQTFGSKLLTVQWVTQYCQLTSLPLIRTWATWLPPAVRFSFLISFRHFRWTYFIKVTSLSWALSIIFSMIILFFIKHFLLLFSYTCLYFLRSPPTPDKPTSLPHLPPPPWFGPCVL